jgi:dTDP-4-amino-4,6-dideoxygalactose transaminase
MSIWKVQLFQTNFDDLERAAAEEVVRSGWLTMGERVEEFERKFGTMLQAEGTCVATTNCTASLHMAMLALDVERDDEVVIPALTFVADANVVRMVGARPVLADCASKDDWNVSAATIERCLTPRTKAVMVLHFAGFPCDMAPIVALCRERGLPLVEDVAHAPGASIAEKACGTFGDISCFSFFSNKNLSVGEGGMVVARDRRLYERLRGLRSHGMTTLTLDRHKGRAVTYDVLAPGLNYRMDEIRAAIGLVQLSKLASGNKRRGDLTARYRSRLSGTAVRIPFEHSRGVVRVPHSSGSAARDVRAAGRDREAEGERRAGQHPLPAVLGLHWLPGHVPARGHARRRRDRSPRADAAALPDPARRRGRLRDRRTPRSPGLGHPCRRCWS